MEDKTFRNVFLKGKKQQIQKQLCQRLIYTPRSWGLYKTQPAQLRVAEWEKLSEQFDLVADPSCSWSWRFLNCTALVVFLVSVTLI